jgi:outer membrane lipoprotein-sorting protein
MKAKSCRRIFSIALFLFSFIFFVQQTRALEAKDIVEKADQHLRGNTSYAEMTMKVVRPNWSREIGIKSWSKGRKLALILITAPVRDQGTTFLLRKPEVWNWIPSIEKVIKIPPSMMMQSWMGSDFTNDDLVKESSVVEDYTHRLLVDSVISGRKCYKIELIPKPDAPVVWGKVFLWISQEDFLELRAEFYDEDEVLINVMQMSEIKLMGGRLIPTVMEMTSSEKPGNKTIIQYKSLEFDLPITDVFFSEQNMKRVR